MDWKTVNTNCYDKVVIPEEQKHTLALVDLELREVEFIVYEKLSQYISYQEV